MYILSFIFMGHLSTKIHHGHQFSEFQQVFLVFCWFVCLIWFFTSHQQSCWVELVLSYKWINVSLGSSPQLTLKKGAPGDQVWDLLCVQLASYLERGLLMWMMPLHLHVNQKSDYDYDMMLKDHNAVTPVRLEPAALRSQVKHSTTEPLRSLFVEILTLRLTIL